MLERLQCEKSASSLQGLNYGTLNVSPPCGAEPSSGVKRQRIEERYKPHQTCTLLSAKEQLEASPSGGSRVG